MKNSFRFRHRPRMCSEQGQTFIPIVVMIAMLLLAMLGVAIDYSQLWAHRQMAQGAADAACQAGAADLFLKATDPSASGLNGLQPFDWIGTTFDCSAKPGTPPCKYASMNGYNGSAVSVSFPGALPNVDPLTPPFTTTTPYIQVTVSDPVPMTFTRLVSSSPTVNIRATAACGLAPVSLPTPLVILHPTLPAALSVGGNSKIIVLGGPQRSIQVNSKDPGAVVVGTNTTPTIDLRKGGPSGDGSDFAVFGGPQNQPAGIDVGNKGHYIFPAFPLSDPFATYNDPPLPGNLGTATPVPFAINGCPDPNGCVEFTPGNYSGCSTSKNLLPGAQGCLMLPYAGTNPRFKAAAPPWNPSQPYTKGALIQPTANNVGNFVYIATNSGTSGAAPGPNPWNQVVCTRQADGTCANGTQPDGGIGGIVWQNVGPVSFSSLSTAIFDPGVYYVAANGLKLGSGSTVRVSTAAGDGSNGVMFYFKTSDTVSVAADTGSSKACIGASAGKGNPNGCVVSYKVDGTLSPQATGAVRSQRLQCPLGSANPPQVPTTPIDGNILLGPCLGNYAANDGNRGFLFFQNRAVSAAPSWGGGGQFLSSGFLYFHSGNGANCGTNTSCLTLQGNSGAQSYTLGNIVVDKLSLGGTPQVNMILNPTATFQVLKPTLLQ
jgi:Flp pilus assembly protein TadG